MKKSLLLCLCLTVLWLPFGCQRAELTNNTSISKVLQYPDQFYGGLVQLRGIAGLPSQSGHIPGAGTFELSEQSGDSAIVVRTDSLPAPGHPVLVTGRVTVDPKTSIPFLVETNRKTLQGI